MSIFVSRYNIISGTEEWCLMPEDYDLKQEIARSAYGDMLHDTDRNIKYHDALKKVITNLKLKHEYVHVLDIGTGTGLLSMMAVRCGADKVTACEAFKPMAHCAKKVIQDNATCPITVVEKRSTDMVIGEDMVSRANVLVAELFDTELIGEGALPSFQHAANELLTEDAIVIPSRGHLYVQAVQSDFLRSHFTILPSLTYEEASSNLRIPSSMLHCRGCPSIYDVQASELVPFVDFMPLTEPTLVKVFPFFPAAKNLQSDKLKIPIHITRDGRVDAFLVWWTIDMDPEGEIVLTCAPKWHSPNTYHWRDHWMQGVYFPQFRKPVSKEEIHYLNYKHDEYSMWMDFISSSDLDAFSPPVCDCGLHMSTSRQRMSMFNSTAYKKFTKNLAQAVCHSSSDQVVCFTTGSFGYLPLYLARQNIETHFLSNCHRSDNLLKQFMLANNIGDGALKIYKKIEEIPSTVLLRANVFVAEPYIESASLDWLNLHFIYLLKQHFKETFALNKNILISPHKLTIFCLAMQFEHLHVIRAPVGSTEGFQLRIFDELVSANCAKVDPPIEPHPLWEYPGRSLSLPIPILELDLLSICSEVDSVNVIKSINKVAFHQYGSFNGIAFWCEWDHVNEIKWSSGLEDNCPAGSKPQWKRFATQGVMFIPSKSVGPGHEFLLHSEFNVTNADFHFVVLDS